MSTLRTAMLLAAMTALFVGVGYLLGGRGGMLIALVFAAGMNIFAWWNSDKMVLRMYRAREVTARDDARLVGTVQTLATRAGLPMPRVYVIDSPQPNAFATGRNPENAAVAVTTGLQGMLGRDELEGVIAHELAHIRNRDTLTMTVTATIAGAISMLAHWALFFGNNRNNPLGLLGTILVMILAPLAAMLVQMAISRTREYSADRTGAEISGKPLALAGALRKLQTAAERIDNERAEAYPATAHMFIVNPLHARRMDNLFSTHPDMNNRVARLEALAGMSSTAAAFESPVQFTSKPPRGGHPLGRRSGHGGRPRGPWG